MTAQANRHNHPGVEKVVSMIEACQASIDSGQDHIVLVLGKRSLPKGERVRLTPVGGPLGELMCMNCEGEIVGRFECAKVIAFLRKGLKEVGVAL